MSLARSGRTCIPSGIDTRKAHERLDDYRSFNALAESFFATLECELIDREHFRARDEARTKIFDYLETWYNPRRRHSALDYLSPLEYERRWQETSSMRSL